MARIVYVITGLGMGGAETQVCKLADKLSMLGHEVTIVYLFGDKVVSPTNQNIHVIGLNLKRNLYSLLTTLKELHSLLRNIEPDVVHSHMYHANILTRLSRVFFRFPRLITSAHNSNEGGNLRYLLYRITYKLSDVNTNVGDTSVQASISRGAVPKQHIISMPNGIDVEMFRPDLYSPIRDQLSITESTKLFISVGRLQEQKDFPNLLFAISKLSNDIDCHFIIAGSNTEQLVSLVDELGIKSRVSLLGVRHDIANLMAQSDVFVLSSRWEGLPIVVGEAMSSGCHIIATDSGGTKEWLSPYEKTIPIESSDKLASAIKHKLAQDSEYWNQISIENRKHIIDNFSIDAVVRNWINIYGFE